MLIAQWKLYFAAEQDLTAIYGGLTVEDAESQAQKVGRTTRVISLGEESIVTGDRNTHRVSLLADKGLVVLASIG